ncbi:MAG TPA: hypothetical protein VFG07_09470 [Thermoplasmata archaeon]|nr:hypothetical protein [Thermoplasmata archaeon]
MRSKVYTIVLLVFGSVLSLASLPLAWYTVTTWNGAAVYHESFYIASVQLSGSQGGSPYHDVAAYSTVWLSHTGQLYLAAAGLVLAGAALGGLTAWVLLRGSGRGNPGLGTALAVLTVLVAASGPGLLWAAQPATICADYSSTPAPLGSPPSGNASSPTRCGWAIAIPGGSSSGYATYSESSPGPQSSFVGFVTGTYYHSWDAGVGWFVALAGAGVDLVALLAYLWTRRRPPKAEGVVGGSPVGSEPT